MMNKSLTLIVCLLMAAAVSAQTASALWPLTSTSSTAVTATGNITGANESFSNLIINNYTGPNASQRVTTTDGNWPAETDQNESRYIQFAVSPAQGFNFNVTEISMNLGASGGSNMRANIWYAVSPDFLNAVKLNQSILVLPNGSFVSPSPVYQVDEQVNEGETLYLRIYPWYTSASSGKYVCPQDVKILGTTSTGTMINISLTTLPDFGTVITGSVSSSAEYQVSGTNLSDNILIQSPQNFEISTDNVSFGNSLQISHSGGVVAPTSIFARFAPVSANGTNTGVISHTTLNAETKNISISGVAISNEPTVSSSISFGSVTGTTIEVSFSGGNGNGRILAVRSGSAVNWQPEDGSVVTGVSNDFSSALDQGNGNKVVYSGEGTSVNVTGLSGSTIYYFAVYEFNAATGNSHNYLTSSPGTGNQTTNAAPTITVSPSSISFDGVEINTISSVKSYTLSANTLSPASGNITVIAPDGFEISSDSITGFSSSLMVPYTDGSLIQINVYVRFLPEVMNLYSGEISNAGGSALTSYVSVSGYGTGPVLPNEFEAEDGLLNRAEIRNEYGGYSGSGYVFLVNRAGAWVEVLFKRETASTDTITVNFSNGSGSTRTLSVSLNDNVQGTLSFPNTSVWTNWSIVKTIVSFEAGINRLRFTTTGTSTNPYLDKIFIHGAAALPVYKLNLMKSGSGIVSAAPSEVYYDAGTQVTLSADPSADHIFTRWFGDVVMLQNPHTILMNSHKTVVGVFMPSNSVTVFPYKQNPEGFASVNALGNNGTTGGAGGTTAIVSSGGDLWNLMLDRQDANNTKNLPPLTVYVSGILSPDPALFGSSKMLDIKDAYDITLIGIGSDATMTGFGLKIFRAKNIIIRNIRFASCPDDGISVDANDDPLLGHHIWIDHCTFTEIPPPGYPSFSSYDGALDITHTAAYVTVSWNKFENTDKNSLVGHSNTNTSDTAMKITYHHNWFKGTVQRNPRVRFAKVHVYNNYYTNNLLYGVSSNMEADVMVEGNYFLNVPIPTETSRDGNPPGDVVERNNIFINCGIPGTRGTAFEPSLFYPYNLDSASAVPDKVMLYAGSGVYDFSLAGLDPIPVELVSFTAKSEGGSVILIWLTAAETNNLGWEIERTGNYSIWQSIAFVPGKGNSVTGKFYTFEDTGIPEGKYYYRLKQIDYDGTFKYSGIVEVEITTVLSYNLFQNYPNPFNPSTVISFDLPENSRVNLTVYNLLGEKTAVLIDEVLEAGRYSKTFDAAGLPSGVYLYVISADNYYSARKMILLR
jgi:pectate lyase